MHMSPILRAGTGALTLVLALAWGADALAQLRPIPAPAKRGEMRHLQGMVVELDGQPVNLAPGAQIRDEDNRIVLPSAMPTRLVVRYLLDAQGNVQRVWVLSAQEVAQPEPGN